MGIYVDWKTIITQRLRSKKGRLLQYPAKLSAKGKIKILCAHKHEFCSTPERLKNGAWCQRCAWDQLSKKFKDKNAIDELKKIAEEKNGKLLSKTYKNSLSPLKWNCANGHIWLARPSNIKMGKWCPFCSGRRKSIQTLREYVAIKGGACLTKKYSGVREKYLWKCSLNHRWEASATNILRGSWCPICSASLTEKLTRNIFESVFEASFYKTRPDWLIGPFGEKLELDGYNSKLKIAFEVQGEQHYSDGTYFGKKIGSLNLQKKRDQAKRDICSEKGITLIEIPARKAVRDLDQFTDSVLNIIRLNGFNVTKKKILWSIVYGDHFTKLKSLQKIASQKQGQLLATKYISSGVKLKWKCKLGHVWYATPAKIIQGTWCPECGMKKTQDSRRHSIIEAKKLAIQKKGNCLSSTYISAKDHLHWKCEIGHEWLASFSKVKSGTWCPYCAGRGLLNMQEIENIILGNQGHLLTKKAKNFHSKIKVECRFGHIWITTPTAIKHASSWCKKCAVKRTSDGQRDSISIYKKLAKVKGGSCLSTNYINNRTSLEFECNKGHRWKGLPHTIKRGSWCRKCSALEGWRKRKNND